MNIKVVETEFGTFLYDDVVRILRGLQHFGSGADGAMLLDNNLSRDSARILEWLVKIRVARKLNYGPSWSSWYFYDKDRDKVLDEITEHERIMEKLTE